MATIEQARALVDALASELQRRRPAANFLTSYYRGHQPLKFASDEFRRYHGDRYKGFADNWTQVVSDSPIERLTAIGVQPVGAEKADTESWRVWQANGLDADSQLGFLDAVNTSRSFALVWGNPEDDETPEVTFEDSTTCIVAYEPGSRRRRRAALKLWEDGDETLATLYLPGEVWKFREVEAFTADKPSQLKAVDEVLKTWDLRETGDEPNPQDNPMGVVPVVEFANRPMLGEADPISDIAGVVAMQDAVNLLWAHLFTAADYAAFPQRLVLGGERPVIPILDENGEVVGERPVDLEKFAVDRVLFLTGDDVKTDEWSAANLNAYTEIIEVAVGHIAAQTRTPQHYLVGKMANLSGDALIAAETGLVKRVEEKQIWFGQSLRELFRLIALAQGNEAKARSLAGGSILWANAASRSEAQMADMLLKLKQIGFPFEYLALRFGLTPTEVAQVLAMREKEALQDPMGAITQMMAHDPRQSVDEEPPEAEEVA